MKDDAGMDAQSAAVIMTEARQRAQRELTVNRRAFAGPAGVWAVDALAVGLPFLLIAALPPARSRAA